MSTKWVCVFAVVCIGHTSNTVEHKVMGQRHDLSPHIIVQALERKHCSKDAAQLADITKLLSICYTTLKQKLQ